MLVWAGGRIMEQGRCLVQGRFSDISLQNLEIISISQHKRNMLVRERVVYG